MVQRRPLPSDDKDSPSFAKDSDTAPKDSPRFAKDSKDFNARAPRPAARCGTGACSHLGAPAISRLSSLPRRGRPLRTAAQNPNCQRTLDPSPPLEIPSSPSQGGARGGSRGTSRRHPIRPGSPSPLTTVNCQRPSCSLLVPLAHPPAGQKSLKSPENPLSCSLVSSCSPHSPCSRGDASLLMPRMPRRRQFPGIHSKLLNLLTKWQSPKSQIPSPAAVFRIPNSALRIEPQVPLHPSNRADLSSIVRA
jgi:hypothetical protein